MSTLTGTRLATLPRVNLLPPEIEETRRFRKVQSGLAAGVVGAVGVVGALFLFSVMQANAAQDELATSNSRNATLQAKANTFAEVPLVYAQVGAAESQLGLAMGQEVRWSYFLNDLSLRTPNKVWLTTMTVAQTAGPVVVAAPSAAPVMEAGIGTVTFSGKGYAHNDVAAWLDALAKQKGLTQPYFTNSALEEIGSRSAVSFTSQATITEEALSGRFTQKAGN